MDVGCRTGKRKESADSTVRRINETSMFKLCSVLSPLLIHSHCLSIFMCSQGLSLSTHILRFPLSPRTARTPPTHTHTVVRLTMWEMAACLAGRFSFFSSGRGRFLFFLVIWCRWLFPLLRLTIKGI